MIKQAAVLIIALGASVAWGLSAVYPAYQQRQELKQTAESIEDANSEARVEIRQERREIMLLQTESKEIARVARDKFGLCKPGEKIYRFIDEEDFLVESK